MSPESEYEQQRYPPRARRPEEQCEPFQKWKDLGKKTRIRRGQDQPCSSERCDCHRAHVDPVRRSECRRGEVRESEAVKNQRDEQQIQHASEQKHTERKEEQQFTVGLEVICQQCPKDG